MRFVLNNYQYGKFNLSKRAKEELLKLGIDEDYMQDDMFRMDQRLIEVVEKLGQEAAGDFCLLKIISVPDDVHWTIEIYKGVECIEEIHRIWL